MGAYREQLLRETYGHDSSSLYSHQKQQEEERTSGNSIFFKVKFTICLLLFAGFAYLNLTGNSFYNITADKIVTAVTEDTWYIELSNLGIYE